MRPNDQHLQKGEVLMTNCETGAVLGERREFLKTVAVGAATFGAGLAPESAVVVDRPSASGHQQEP
jgi:hypothetical protein